MTTSDIDRLYNKLEDLETQILQLTKNVSVLAERTKSLDSIPTKEVIDLMIEGSINKHKLESKPSKIKIGATITAGIALLITIISKIVLGV